MLTQGNILRNLVFLLIFGGACSITFWRLSVSEKLQAKSIVSIPVEYTHCDLILFEVHTIRGVVSSANVQVFVYDVC